MEFVNTIITHITDGNENEERLVNVMGGTVIETLSEKLIKQGIAIGISQRMEQGVNERINEGKNQEISQGIAQGMLLGQAKMMIELNQEAGVDDAVILKQMREKLHLSKKEAAMFLKKYGKAR